MLVSFEQMLYHHCAPALMGLKPSNIMTLRKKEQNWQKQIDSCREQLAEKGIRCDVLCECQEHLVVMIYRPEVLRKALETPERAAFLKQYGYENPADLDQCLSRLSMRMRRAKQGFPHEIGIFLGYPLADVEGFIEQKGENCKFSGYWKVYGSAEEAQELFTCYENCRRKCLHLASLGWGLEAILAQSA
jgi:hypothetical protein